MIVITGGGTGGHLSIAKTVAQEYNKLGIKPIYIGSTKGQDRAWFENSPLFSQTFFLNSYGIVNQNFFGKIKSLINILKLCVYVRKIFKQNGVKKVFSVGGYSAASASIAAVLSRKALFIHEQNAYTGRLNRLLTPFAKIFFSSYSEKSPVKDYPVEKEWFDIQKNTSKLKTIAFLGGSQGAKAINEIALEIALYLKERNIKIVHQAGKEYEAIKEFYDKNDIDADVFEFFSPLYTKLKDVDLAISRSGAGSMWELCAANIFTIFIPYPYAAGNHQYFNAKILEDRGACKIIKQNDLDKEKLILAIESLNFDNINSPLKNLIEPNGGKKIVEAIENYKL
jgi:UDP-N-acetylglucosamine--N-acetylmuramyl-(pentapeptide) pyrophosphoryl-undecaprenol N-acetylglucosamine transferase